MGEIFLGDYNDPKHSGCLRKITMENDIMFVIGSDNEDSSNEWKLEAKQDTSGGILVDFSKKSGPKDLLGIYEHDNGGIRWSDDNLWKKL